MQNLVLHWRRSRPDNLATAAQASSSATSSNCGVTVHLPSNLYVSGGPVEGEVELDFAQLRQDNIQDVRVKLRGRAETFVTINTTTTQETISLVRVSVTLWTNGAAYPAPGSNSLRIPFSFQLPTDLPPSLSYVGGGGVVSIRYALTAVAVRPGAFHRNRRVRVPIALVHADPPEYINIRNHLLRVAAASETTLFKTYRTEDNVRKGLWGDYGSVKVQLMIPELPVLPLFVPIPFVIEIKTTSPPLTRAKADALPQGKPVFPAAPEEFSALQFKLRRSLRIRANPYVVNSSSDVAVFTKDPNVLSAVQTERAENGWYPLHSTDEKSTDAPGKWIQHVTFRSSFSLACAHTFEIDNVDSQFQLELTVPVAGVGNNVHIKVPVVLTSGLDAPVELNSLYRSLGSNVLAAGSTTTLLDLPPSYWDADDNGWDDEKD
ncbi:hypothetical protein PYCCODRAFT_1441092 [Trametes coccinea BRFM310]|uniref:Arrestin-like N-terminal domain-containing protein n=1 Tax=Trametes coccinea (strain BRFM310) TaxID=1353009 RepID=A0A1Y2I5H1_TRAC3|nr:hypothetical protein PYCCODRAFT_1441092 [Trametes coccinea BRFM310]